MNTELEKLKRFVRQLFEKEINLRNVLKARGWQNFRNVVSICQL